MKMTYSDKVYGKRKKFRSSSVLVKRKLGRGDRGRTRFEGSNGSFSSSNKDCMTLKEVLGRAEIE